MVETHRSDGSIKLIDAQEFGRTLLKRAVEFACNDQFARAEQAVQHAAEVLRHSPTGALEVLTTKGRVLRIQGDLTGALELHKVVDAQLKKMPDVDLEVVKIHRAQLAWTISCLTAENRKAA